jgi:ABC-type nitrate/sulfonate/bicarbonate transport system substrate-binding protein
MTDNPPSTRPTSSLPDIRIGGVPEHFNYPLHMVKKLGLDTKFGVNLIFAEQACGTGQMISNLKDKSVDLIVALTEGITADIAKGSDVRILGTYVSSPLCWAISGAGPASASQQSTGPSTNASTALPRNVADMKGKTFGISRYGSGSQLMAYVLANERGWDPQHDVQFKVIGKFQHLRDRYGSGD